MTVVNPMIGVTKEDASRAMQIGQGLAMRPQIPTGRKRIPGVSGGGFEGVGAIGPAGTTLPVGGPGIVANNYGANNYGDYVNNLPSVTDPDKTYANITRQEYLDYVNNYRDFEEQMIEESQNDTSLIESARENAGIASGLAQGISDRNASRYGAQLTPAQIQQQTRGLERANTLGSIQSVNDATIAQDELNQRKLADLINIGQGVNRSSLSQMGSAAANATQRKNAYDSARAASKAQTYSTLGSLGSMAIMALAF
jgi:hypothetical protein